MESDSPFGIIRHTAPVAKYSETPSIYELPVVPLGANPPGLVIIYCKKWILYDHHTDPKKFLDSISLQGYYVR
jgi:hypothetical protein